MRAKDEENNRAAVVCGRSKFCLKGQWVTTVHSSFFGSVSGSFCKLFIEKKTKKAPLVIRLFSV